MANEGVLKRGCTVAKTNEEEAVAGLGERDARAGEDASVDGAGHRQQHDRRDERMRLWDPMSPFRNGRSDALCRSDFRKRHHIHVAEVGSDIKRHHD